MDRSASELTMREKQAQGVRRIRSRWGTSYVEYFIVAGAMAVAAGFLFEKLDNIKAEVYEPQFQGQMDEIAGPLSGVGG